MLKYMVYILCVKNDCGLYEMSDLLIVYNIVICIYAWTYNIGKRSSEIIGEPFLWLFFYYYYSFSTLYERQRARRRERQ